MRPRGSGGGCAQLTWALAPAPLETPGCCPGTGAQGSVVSQQWSAAGFHQEAEEEEEEEGSISAGTLSPAALPAPACSGVLLLVPGASGAGRAAGAARATGATAGQGPRLPWAPVAPMGY